MKKVPGSTLVPSVGEGVPPSRTFKTVALEKRARHTVRPGSEVRFGGTPKPTLGTSVLPGVFGTRLLFALIFLISTGAHAAGPLTAEIKPVALRARAFAPEALDVKLTWSGSGLLEGALELSFPGADENAPRFLSHDLALTSGAKEFRLMIPSASSGGGFSREVIARFVTKSATDFRSPTASTFPVHLDAEEMPASVLAYTAYDIVLLDGVSFAQLREKQLAALSRWVLAGGSLCVIASAPLENVPCTFLAELLAADPRGVSLEINAEGRALMKSEGGVLSARPGFGRLVVAASAPQSDVEANTIPWRRAVAFLWKLREMQAAEAVAEGAWLVGENDRDSWRRGSFRQQLANSIAPKNVRLLPYPVLLLLLAAFVFVIGPVDWLTLGRFRLRRLTWIVFPMVAVAFTALTVVLANRSMGRSNHRSMLTITDLGHDGRVLRETRFEMIFPARNQEVTTEVRSALFASMSVGGHSYGNRPKNAPASCEGVFPTRYLVRQSLSQWSPQLNRFTSLEGERDESGIDWAKLHPAKLASGSASDHFANDRSWAIGKLHGGTFTELESTFLPRDFLRNLCVPRPFRWFNACSQLSPNGADEFEDLALAGEKDVDVSVTIVAHREGENLHIYRHLYAP